MRKPPATRKQAFYNGSAGSVPNCSLLVVTLCVLVCLPVCGFVSGNRARLARAADSGVLRPTRRIHIRRRGRVLHNSPPPASVRSAAAPTVTAHGTSGRVRRAASRLGLAPAPRAVSPGVFTALRAAMLRRRNTAFSPCDVYHRASAEPSRCVSLSSPLGTPLRFLTTC